MKLKIIKICIALFWLFLFSLLLYGMIFISTRNFKELYYAVDVLLLIFFIGFSSIFLEKLHPNVSITYFLLWYFGVPVLFAMRATYSLLIQEIRANTPIEIGLFCIGFLLFAFLSVLGFISYTKRQYKSLTIYIIVCASFYFMFLPFASICFFGIEK